MTRLNIRSGDRELQEVWKRDDDWTDVTTKEERKKRQNRLNQRAYRRRHQEKSSTNTKQKHFRIERFRISEVSRPVLTGGDRTKTSKSPRTEESKRSSTLDISNGDHPLLDGATLSVPQPVQTVSTRPLNSLVGFRFSAPLAASVSIGSELASQNSSTIPGSTLAGNSYFDSHAVAPDSMLLDAFLPYSKDINLSPPSQNFAVCFDGISSPKPHQEIDFIQDSSPILFPISSDHLLHLIHQNVYRALMTNKSLLKAAASLRNVELGIVIPKNQNFCDGVSIIHAKNENALPQSLQPTIVQMNTAHSSWMNSFPFPKLRDNLIRYERDFDHGDLCNDLFGDLYTNGTPSQDASSATSCSSALSSASTSETSIVDPWEELNDEVTAQRKGLIVWGESWDAANWEITPGFVKKWPWLLRDCEDLIACSNRWRAKRFEEPLMYPSQE